MITPQQERIIKEITGKYYPTLLGVFGSYARNEHTENSDLDLLIDFNENINLLELIGLEQELSEMLGIKVDLITVKSFNKRLEPFVTSELIRIV